MIQIDLQPTFALHDQLRTWSRTHESAWRASCNQARERLHKAGIRFEGGRDLPLALTALLLRPEDEKLLCQATERLHQIVEQALDHLLNSPELLERHFPTHRRMFPYLRKTSGQTLWQGISRYDATLDANGLVKFIELNTACPAGFFNTDIFSDVTAEALQNCAIPLDFQIDHHATIQADSFMDGLLQIERQSGHTPQVIGLLNDENGLKHELDLMVAAFALRGRQAVVAPAQELELRNGRTYWREYPLSLAYHKLRISTERSPNHCWKAGFEDRYAAFLSALNCGALPAMNNMAAMTVAEDKSLLAVLRHEDVQAILSDEDKSFLAENVLWTAILPQQTKGDKRQPQGDEASEDELNDLYTHRERWVIKPANEGRGFGVVVGKYATAEAWAAACQPRDDLPCIIQRYAEPAHLPVMLPTANELQEQPMFLTLAFGLVLGRYQGLMSRVSAKPVTNVALHGTLQAAYGITG